MVRRTLPLLLSLALVARCCSKSPRLKSEVPRRECPYAVMEGLNVTDTALSNLVDLHRGTTEVKFDGALGETRSTGESRRPCKLRCVNGEWVGPLCLNEKDTDGKYHPVYKGCTSEIFQHKFVVTYKNKTVLGVMELPHTAAVQVRCRQFGLFKLIGDARLSCFHGNWTSRLPTCIPTSSLSNYSDDSAPPTVLAKITAGSVSVEPTGELAVYPGSIVHLDCLYLRTSGMPEWSWTSTYRTYPTGWAINDGERNQNFRLSIYYIKPQDTGIYTCATPKGLTHSVVLNVVAVYCDVTRVVTTDPNLLTQVEGSRLGQEVTFQCREGFKINGSHSISCQASGTWSGYPPGCIPVVCANLTAPQGSPLKLVRQDTTFGGRAVFQCPIGHKTVGTTSLECQGNGTWSADLPTCKEITCPAPLMPPNSKLEYTNASALLRAPFRAGSVLTFSCKGVHQLVGEETILCQESGFWSNPPPFCKTRCPHPGDPAHGHFTPSRPDYEVGERLLLTCDAGHEPSSRSRPRCQRSGAWTEGGQECRFRPGRPAPRTTDTPPRHNDTESRYNGTDVFYLVED